jgi:hypothetical protein
MVPICKPESRFRQRISSKIFYPVKNTPINDVNYFMMKGTQKNMRRKTATLMSLMERARSTTPILRLQCRSLPPLDGLTPPIQAFSTSLHSIAAGEPLHRLALPLRSIAPSRIVGDRLCPAS